MNRGATIVFAATRLVRGRISDQTGAGLHRFATACMTESEAWPPFLESNAHR